MLDNNFTLPEVSTFVEGTILGKANVAPIFNLEMPGINSMPNPAKKCNPTYAT
jgi:hypothetical protein